jgi:hypothetical protein
VVAARPDVWARAGTPAWAGERARWESRSAAGLQRGWESMSARGWAGYAVERAAGPATLARRLETPTTITCRNDMQGKKRKSSMPRT